MSGVDPLFPSRLCVPPHLSHLPAAPASPPEKRCVMQRFRHFSPWWHKFWPLCSICVFSFKWMGPNTTDGMKETCAELSSEKALLWVMTAVHDASITKKDLKIGWCVLARRYWKRNKPRHVWAAHPAGRSAIAQLSLVPTRVRFGGGGHKRLICERTGMQLHVIAQNKATRVIS